MFAVKSIYLLLMVAMGTFFILYEDPLSLILLLTIVILPVVLWIISLIAKLGTKISVDIDRTVVAKGTPARLKITVDNRSIISVSCIKLIVSYENRFYGEKTTESIIFPAHACKKSTIKCDVNSIHCGHVHVEVKKALFYDFFKIWKYRKKLNGEFDITFIPETHIINANINLNSCATFEADTFSKHKSGDDPSEVFKIRDYAGGDKLNRIHWKLSLKQDNLLVKEYSLPINHAIVLLLEFNPDPSKETMNYIDGIIESTVAISSFLIDNEISHVIAWYDKSTEHYCRKNIESQESLFEIIGVLLQNRLCIEDTPALLNFTQQRMLDKCSHLLYITPHFTEHEMTMMDDPKFKFSKTAVYITSDKSLSESSRTNDINIVSVSPDDIGESLYNLVI